MITITSFYQMAAKALVSSTTGKRMLLRWVIVVRDPSSLGNLLP
ncbi:hypothetical protein [Photobacterium leiognathi]|nr:hypothetical protein [Photobacterium leiognathi]